jgi:hypothetical protein
MNGFVRGEIEDRMGGKVFGDEGPEILFRQFGLSAAAQEFFDIPLCGGNQRRSVSAGFNDMRRAVVWQNLGDAPLRHGPKIAQMDVKPGWFIDVGDGIFERIAR